VRHLLLLAAILVGTVPAQVPTDDDARTSAAQARVQEQDVLGEIDRIDRQLQGLSDEIASLQAQVDQVEARRLQAEDDLSATQAQLDLQATEVRTRCLMLYRISRRGLARVLFDAESSVDLRRTMHYLVSILARDKERIAAFNEAVSRKKASLGRVDKDRSVIAALQADLRLKEATLRDERARKLTLLEEVRTKKDLALRAMAQAAAESSSFAQVTLLPSNAADAAVDPGTRLAADFRKSHGRLSWPTTGRLIRGFGPYLDPMTGEQAKNLGIDVDAAYGTPFRAVFDGTVTKAGFIRGYGQTVVLDHGSYSTVYAHANGLKVNPGQTVRQGDVLGYVGNSGLVDATGYRLHFEVRYNSTPQDPMEWLSPYGGR